jgi:hypothetical protein
MIPKYPQVPAGEHIITNSGGRGRRKTSIWIEQDAVIRKKSSESDIAPST